MSNITVLKLTVNNGVDTRVGNSKQEQASLYLGVDFAGRSSVINKNNNNFVNHLC